MTSRPFLSITAVVLILAGTVVLTLGLTLVAPYVTERRGNEGLLLWLVAIWVLMSVVALVLSPSGWPGLTT